MSLFKYKETKLADFELTQFAEIRHGVNDTHYITFLLAQLGKI